MKLSIIVPFHQGIHFLEDCLESIRDQGIVDYETILVLDHVKEDLSQIIAEYQDINLTTIELNKPQRFRYSYTDDEKVSDFKCYSGVAAARNAGLEAASGEYVYFLDSDDYILNGTLTFLLKEAQELKADITYGRKVTTWFRKMVFLNELMEHNGENLKEEQDSNGDLYNDSKIINIPEEIKKVQRELDQMEAEGDQASISKAEAYYRLFVSRKGISDISVLGILFRRDFLMEHKIHFHEEYCYYVDTTFMVQMLKQLKVASFVEEAIYVKRRHNDPIHFPAISQSKSDNKFDELIAVYKAARKFTGSKDLIRQYLEMKLIMYFAYTYAPRLWRSEKEDWKDKRFQVMRECMKEVDPERIASLSGYKKAVVHTLLKGNVKQVTFFVMLYLARIKIKKIRKNKRVFAYHLYHKYFTKLPIKENYVLCESFFGKSYSDSPKYIYEYLCKNYPGKYKFIWVMNKKTKIPYHPIQVKRFSIRYCYYMAVCKYNIFNVRQPEWVRKRKGNIFLETWHGTPLKKLVFDQEEVMGASPLYKAQFYKQSRVWDYLISANHFSTKAFQSAFLFDKEILEYGYPRNDILYSPDKDEIAAQIRKKLNIPEGKKTILYAPTWRDDEYYGRGEYKFALKLDLRLLKRELGDDYVVLLRTHYFIADSLDVTGLEDFAINVSKYNDISELYLISDLLITDYSSVFFDFANLKRPILFYTYDLDKYRDMIRGFYLDIEKDVPGPLLYTNEEVVDAIKNIDAISAEYQEIYDSFYEKFCSLEDGHAAEKVAKKVFDLS
ncbi:MAG: bifunctional glycosyltransferase family 2 protein/CDP-glycerol:glycerophosphate glycerophosphotransferase [Clostridiales bacterium]|nr:bifunctional glycosyltransferase family 2 protein/CDP-glycerol:glycerophosphate glycerophosphotransferase [Clostridiales bacterium]